MPPTNETVLKVRMTQDVVAQANLVSAATTRMAQQAVIAGQQMATANGVTGQSFQKLTNNVKVFEGSAGQLMARITTTSQTVDEHGNAIKKAHKSWSDYMTGIATGIGLYTVASAVVNQFKAALGNAAQAAIGLNSMLEQNRIGFETFLGSAYKAEKMMYDLYKFAAVTPFTFPGVVDATKKMLAFGFTAEEVIPTLRAVGNAASALGSGDQGIDRITIALGQMSAKGKVQGGELRQLGEAGIRVMDIMSMVAEKYGVSMGTILKMQEQGEVKAADFIEAFKKYSELHFGDMMAKQALTFAGAMSTIKDVTQMTIANAFAPLYNTLSKKTVDLSAYMQTTKFQQDMNGVLDTIGNFLGAIGNLVRFVTSNLIPLGTALSIMFAKTIVVALLSARAALISFIQAAQAGTISALANPFLLLAVAVGAAMIAFQKFNEVSAESEKVAQNTIDYAKKQSFALGDSAQDYINLTAKVADYDAAMNKATFGGEAGIGNMLSRFFVQLTQGGSGIPAAKAKLQEYQDQINSVGVMAAAQAVEIEKFNRMIGKPSPKIQEISSTEQQTKNIAELESATKAYNDTFGKTIEKMVTAGDVSYNTGQDMLKMLNIVPVNNFSLVIDTINEKMTKLGASEQALVQSKLGEVFEKMRAGVVDSNVALSLMKVVLSEVDVLAAKAADVKRWVDLGAAIAGGIAGILMAEPEKVKGIVDANEIAKEQLAVEKLNAEILESEERLRRMQGIASTLNWTQPVNTNSAQYKAEKADLDALILKRKEANQSIAESTASNESFGTRTQSAYAKAIQAIGNYMSAKVMQKELDGSMSTVEAEKAYAFYEKAFGAALSAEDQMARTAILGAKSFEDLGYAGIQAQALIAKGTKERMLAETDANLKGALGAKVQVQLTKDWEVAIRGAKKELSAVGVDGEKAITSLIDTVANAPDPLKAFKDGIMELVTIAQNQSPKFEKVMSDMGGEARIALADGFAENNNTAQSKKQADIGTAVAMKIVEGYKLELINKAPEIQASGLAVVQGFLAGVTSPGAESAIKGGMTSFTESIIGWIRYLLQEHSPSKVTAELGAFAAQGFVDGMTGSTAQSDAAQGVVDYIQVILNKFSGLSIDPRVKDMADSVQTVVNAFGAAIKSLTELDTYISPARDVVDIAFNDMKYISDKMISAGTVFDINFNWEGVKNFGDTVGTMMNSFGAAVEALSSVRKYIQPARATIDKVIADMLYVAQALIDAAGKIKGDVTGAAELATAVSTIGAGLSDLIDPLEKIGKYVGLSRDAVTGMSPNLNSFIADLSGLFGRLQYLAVWLKAQGENTAKNMQALGEVMSSVFAPLGDLVDVLVNINSYVPLDRIGGTSHDLDRFMIDMQGLFGRLKNLSDWLKKQDGELGDTASDMKSLGETMLVAFEPLSNVLEILSGIGEYTGLTRSGGTSKQLDAFMADMYGLFGRLKSLSDWLKTQGAAGDMKELGAVMKEVFGGLSEAIGVIKSVTEMTTLITPEELDVRLINIGQLLGFIALNILDWKEGQILTPALIESVKGFAESINKIISPVSNIVSTVKSVMEFVGTDMVSESDLDSALITVGGLLGIIALNINDWAESDKINKGILEGLKDYSTLLSTVISPVQSIVSTVKALSDFAKDGGAAGSAVVESAMSGVSDVLGVIVQSLKDWSEDTVFMAKIAEVVAAQNGKFLGNISAIMQPIQGLVSAIKSIAEFKKVDNVALKMSGLMDNAKEIYDEMMAEFGGWEETTPATGAGKAAAAFASVIAPVQALVAAIKSVAEYEVPSVDIAMKIANIYAKAAEIYNVMIFNFTGIDKDTNDIVDLAAKAAASFAALIAPVQSMVSSIKAVAEYIAPVANISAQIASIYAKAAEIYNVMIFNFSNIDENAIVLVELAGRAAAAFVSLLAPVTTMVSAIKSVAEYVTPTVNISLQIDDIVAQSNLIYARVNNHFSSWTEEMITAAQLAGKAASAFASLLAPISTMVTAIKSVSEYVKPVVDIGTRTTSIIEKSQLIYERMNLHFASWDEAMIEQKLLAGKGAAAAATLLAPISAMSAAIKTVSEYIKPTVDLGSRTTSIIEKAELIYTRMNLEFAAWDEAMIAQKLLAGRGAAAAASLLAPVKTMVDAISAVKDYFGFGERETGMIPDQMQALANDIRDMMTAMDEALEDILISEDDTAAADFLAAILAPIKSWIDSVVDLRKYVSPGTVKIQKIRDDIVSLIVEIAKIPAAVMAAGGNSGTIAAVGAMSTTLAPVSSFLSGMVDLFDKVNKIQLPSDFDQKVREIGLDVGMLIAGLGAIVISPTELATIDKMKTYLLPMAQGMNEMMLLFQGLANYKALDRSTASTFLHDMTYWVQVTMTSTSWGDWGINAGRSLVDGIATGLSAPDCIDRMETAAYALAYKVENALRTAWGIASPSKVMIGIGKNVVAGLEQGLVGLDSVGNVSVPAITANGVVTPQSSSSSIVVNFTGDINANNPQDLQKIVDAVGSALSMRASRNQKMITVAY